jgi:hypothetical protein
MGTWQAIFLAPTDRSRNVNDEEFIKGRVRLIKDIAEDANPFIKHRLLQLAATYERRLARSSRPPVSLAGLATKLPSER